jgi:hypothetical protein
MRPLSDADVLSLWETGRKESRFERALTILSAAESGPGRQELASLSLGAHNAQLLDLYLESFGPRLQGFAECPSCAAPLEVEVDVEQLEASSAPAGPNLERSMTTDGYTLRFRLPVVRDLATAASARDEEEARRVLLGACVAEVKRDGRQQSPGKLPRSVVSELAGELARLDPQADLRLELNCPDCSHVWELTIDPAEYLWGEVSALARKLLHEVDALARAYGWSEAEILALGAARREAYLDLVL